MALDQLLGPKIQLTLNIKEGHGFGFLTCPILISSSLKGHVIETDIVQPSPNPEFNTQLVWETDKKKIKRLRLENTVLKIDCKQIENKRSERIGYIYINLKQVQIVPRGKQPTDMWCRLLGICKEARSLSPELFLSLAIEDIPENVSAAVSQCLPLPDARNQDTKVTKSSTIGFMVMPVYHEDEDTIQLGPDTPLSEVFLFTIQILAINKLNMLIPEDTEIKDGPYIVFSLMEHSVKSQSLNGYEQGLNKVDSCVVIRVRSTVLMLSAYFKQSPDAEMKLIINDDRVLGSSSVHIQKLVPSEDFATVCNKFGKHNSRYIETRCHIIQNNETDVVPTEERTYIDVVIRLSYENKQPKNKQKISELSNNKGNHPITPASKDDGDNRSEEVELVDANEMSTIPPLELQSSQLDSEPNSPSGKVTYIENRDSRLLTSYVVTVVINSIVVSKLPESGTLEFRFLHLDTDIINTAKQKFIISTANEKINLPFAKAQLYFSSPADLVDNFLHSNPMKITLYDKTVIFATSVLNFPKGQKEDSLRLPLESNNGQKGFIYVSVLVQERQDQSSPPIEGSGQSSSSATHCNEEVLEKIVSELEDWKEKQQQIFQDELEVKEKQHLAKVEEDWLAHKKAIENNLLEQVESNKKMSESLSVALSNLKLREKDIEEKEIQLKNSIDDLESGYNTMHQELREASKHMQDDLNYKLLQMDQEKHKLENQVASLESDKTKLLKVIEGLQIQIKADKTEELTKEIKSLHKQMEDLRSQLDTEVQSKNFFKEQWGKAVRELHRSKQRYDATYSTEQLKDAEEIKNDILYQALYEEEQAMKQDQIKLKQLRSELFTQHKSQENTAAPIALAHTSSYSDTSTWKGKSMVEKLVQQRNEMLLSGDSLYESHIQRLNQQINFLMQ